MRVAHFIQRYPPALGGSEAYFGRLSRFFAACGEQVTVATTQALDLESFWSRQGRCLPSGTQNEDGVEVHRYRLWRCPGRRYLLKALALVPHRRWQCLMMPCNPIAWDMWRDAGCREPAFDLVHATAFPYAWPIVCALRLARRQGVPFVLTPFLHLGDLDDPADPTRRAYLAPALRMLLQAADRVFVQTELEREVLLDQGLAAEKLVLLGMGVEPAECTGGDRWRSRTAWGIERGEVVLGHLANNSQEKGSVDLLRAAERLWDSGQRFRLVLAGPEMPNFRRFWNQFGSPEKVLRLGVLTESAKRDFYAGIDLFALPSRSDSFGIVLLEAWANGLANVGYRAGGIAEVTRDHQDGRLVRCGDVDGLAQALRQLLADEQLRIRLGKCGQERVQRDCRWPEKLERVRTVYAALIEEKLRQKQKETQRKQGLAFSASLERFSEPEPVTSSPPPPASE